MTVKPNGVNVIPSEVQWTVDIRDVDEKKRDRVEDGIKQFVQQATKERGLHVTLKELQRIAPVLCDDPIQQLIKQSMEEELNEEAVSTPSGAGHDAMQLKRIAPVGMIFVRSKDGINHNPKEFTSEEDIEKAGNVLYRTLLHLDKN